MIEVLLTIVIVGTVAALTIPNLIKMYQNSQYVTSLQKFYTQFNQVLQHIALDYGCVGDLKCTNIFDVGTTHASFGDLVASYFKLSKNCKGYPNKGCWAASTDSNYDNSGTAIAYARDANGFYKFVTEDGVSVFIVNYAQDYNSPNCSKNFSMKRTGDMAQVCGYLYVDVNGPKKPNAMGRDTFLFWIVNGKGPLLYPCGGKDDGDWGGDR